MGFKEAYVTSLFNNHQEKNLETIMIYVLLKLPITIIATFHEI